MQSAPECCMPSSTTLRCVAPTLHCLLSLPCFQLTVESYVACMVRLASAAWTFVSMPAILQDILFLCSPHSSPTPLCCHLPHPSTTPLPFHLPHPSQHPTPFTSPNLPQRPSPYLPHPSLTSLPFHLPSNLPSPFAVRVSFVHYAAQLEICRWQQHSAPFHLALKAQSNASCATMHGSHVLPASEALASPPLDQPPSIFWGTSWTVFLCLVRHFHGINCIFLETGQPMCSFVRWAAT